MSWVSTRHSKFLRETQFNGKLVACTLWQPVGSSAALGWQPQSRTQHNGVTTTVPLVVCPCGDSLKTAQNAMARECHPACVTVSKTQMTLDWNLLILYLQNIQYNNTLVTAPGIITVQTVRIGYAHAVAKLLLPHMFCCLEVEEWGYQNTQWANRAREEVTEEGEQLGPASPPAMHTSVWNWHQPQVSPELTTPLHTVHTSSPRAYLAS